MNLFEFFGKSVINNHENDDRHSDSNKDKITQEQEKIRDEIYWYLLDNDELHKKYCLPLIKEIFKNKNNKNFNLKRFSKKFMPMINRACIQYYKELKLSDDPNDIFPRKFRLSLCKRLATQICKDIKQNEYSINEMMAPPSGPTIPATGHLSLEEKKIKQRLDPKCWKGYRKAGTKIKGGVRVNNCVKIQKEETLNFEENDTKKPKAKKGKVIKSRLDATCWKGYRKHGTKVKDNTRVNNCVKISEAWNNEIAKLIKLLENK